MAQQKLSYLNLYTTDPAWNLAAEQYVFDRLPRDRTYFMLWQNDNAIIIGKHQNTAAEINEQFVRENGVRVVRRLSGRRGRVSRYGEPQLHLHRRRGRHGVHQLPPVLPPGGRRAGEDPGVTAEINAATT